MCYKHTEWVNVRVSLSLLLANLHLLVCLWSVVWQAAIVTIWRRKKKLQYIDCPKTLMKESGGFLLFHGITYPTKYTVVCSKHWPSDFKKSMYYGKERPASPPSVFDCVKPSLVPTKPPNQRKTKKATSSVRNVHVSSTTLIVQYIIGMINSNWRYG